MEYLDILDNKGNKTGEIKSYEEAHEEGLIHKAIHVWIVNTGNQLLIQKREKNRVAYPGYWDISASGHISAGQTSLVAAQRETKEELGIEIPATEFEYLFTLEEHLVLNDGTYINNEFQDIYLVKIDLDISQIIFSEEEVEAVRFIDIEEFKILINGGGEPMVPHKEEYQRLLERI